MTHHLLRNTLLAATAALSLSAVAATSTFELGAEGWTAAGDIEGPLTWLSSGGNPGGHVQIDDLTTGGVTYFVAPVKFLGNQSAAAGTLLRFDLKQVYPGRYDPARLLSLIREQGVTFSHCVPTILAMVLAAPEVAAADLTRWKVLIGGSALSEGLARQARAHGIDVHAAYGMSETCPFITHADMLASQGSDDLSLRTATGRPSPLVEVRVVDPDMADVPKDGATTGEVIARAPWLTQGYLKNDGASVDLWQGGWLHTGDVGHLSPDGTLRITDRLKDVIKSGGEWVSSLTLEDLVSTVPGLIEVAAVGVPESRWGERPVLVVVSEPSDTVDASIRLRISAAIERGELPKWAAPDRIFRVAALPRTSVGKIDKKRIRQMLETGEIA